MNMDFERTSFSFYSYRMESTGGSLICYLAISNSQIEIHIVAEIEIRLSRIVLEYALI